MTASVLNQDPNTKMVEQNAIYDDKNNNQTAVTIKQRCKYTTSVDIQNAL